LSKSDCFTSCKRASNVLLCKIALHWLSNGIDALAIAWCEIILLRVAHHEVCVLGSSVRTFASASQLE